VQDEVQELELKILKEEEARLGKEFRKEQLNCT
jgi:hypothetical protein